MTPALGPYRPKSDPERTPRPITKRQATGRDLFLAVRYAVGQYQPLHMLACTSGVGMARSEGIAD